MRERRLRRRIVFAEMGAGVACLGAHWTLVAAVWFILAAVEMAVALKRTTAKGGLNV